MVRHLLGAALLTLIVGGCSSSPIDPSTEQGSSQSEGEVGSVSLPLTANIGDTAYRLNTATFTITGPALGGKPRVVKPPADEPVHNEILPVGSYSIQLEKGWVLEKKGPEAKAFSAVPATVVTDNPLDFEVTGKVVADAFFGFATANGDIPLGNGSVNIRIGVQDCSSYDSYTAALGALTADCLGTVDPRSYTFSRDGQLQPAFAECPGSKTAMRKIRQLLSIQQRTARLPYAKQCLSQRFNAAQTKFAASGVNVCPTWKKGRVVNPIDEGTIKKVEAGLPNLPAADTGKPLDVLDELKVNSLYDVQLDVFPDKKQCTTAAECAMLCAEGFPGFVIDTLGDTSLLTDPVAWLLDNTYSPPKTPDPFQRATYYHPMSYYGGTPGVLFGDAARAEPCGPSMGSPPAAGCEPEQCSYFAGSHLKTRLQKDCLIPGNEDTCVSYCGPLLPATPVPPVP